MTDTSQPQPIDTIASAWEPSEREIAEAQAQVTQADREAAADFVEGWEAIYEGTDCGPTTVHGEFLRTGDHDREMLVQAFARHRQHSDNALRELIERAAEIVPDYYVNWHAAARAALGGR